MGAPRPLPPASEVDVAIIGAGAAGIAAARRCLAEGLTCIVLEARGRVGGRAVTASVAGHSVDLGAHWMHAGSVNPLVRLAIRQGERVRRAPRGGGYLVTNGRFGSADEAREQGRAFDRADQAIAAAARGAEDVSVAAALPPLGRWGSSVAATLALVSGRPLHEVSAKDFPSEEFGDNYFVQGGYGAFLSRLGAGLPIALGHAVGRVDWSGEGVVLEGPAGRVRARAALVTASMPVLAAGAIRFRPALPDGVADAIGSFLPGTYEHVVLAWPDAPFRKPDRFAKLISGRAAYGMMTRIDGGPLHYLELDHETATSFAGRSPAGRARLARGALREQLGPRAIDRLRIVATTDWAADPWSRCAWAVAPPGRSGAREELSRPVGDRLWFAGEANHRAMWGTVGGAWASGDDAAVQIAARLRNGR